MRRKTAEAVRKAVRYGLTTYRARVHTFTYDNGSEFADHDGMASDLETRVYVTHSYSSSKCGLNVNTNRLIRQYFPKRLDPITMTKTETERVMDKLKHCPSMSLGFRTLYEVFFNATTSPTVVLQS